MTAKGMPFARTKALAKILKAVEVDMPSASQMADVYKRQVQTPQRYVISKSCSCVPARADYDSPHK